MITMNQLLQLLKPLVLLIAALFVNECLYSQINSISNNPVSASSNVALNKETIQIGNDPYNGRVNISAPIFNYNFEGIPFSISLQYASSNGVKPDELPGWVGSGWGLETGGEYVHRTVRSWPDEVRDFKSIIEYKNDKSHGAPIKTTTKETILNNQDFSYFSNKNLLQNSNWYSEAFAMANRVIRIAMQRLPQMFSRMKRL